jgi:glutamate formiminotransferase
LLLTVPNVSEGVDAARVSRLGEAFASGVHLLDSHSDAVHNRSVFTLAGDPDAVGAAVVAGARASIEEIDMASHDGVHPCVGALDVCPVVWVSARRQDEAERAARALAGEISELGVPVFLYGALASSPERRERAFFRRGGLRELGRRMAAGELTPDEGPSQPHPSAGATLVTARQPLAAFNVELDSADVDAAREIAAELRESGGGLPGVRAIGLPRGSQRTQISTNVHDPVAVPLARVIEHVRELAAAFGSRPVAAELVGLVPEGALAGYPDDVPIAGFDPDRQLIERRLAALI